MPRRDKSNKPSSKDKGPPPNHPSENFREHRTFLIRSLERNDVDMAALLRLSATLHEAKEKILQTCGELVLLDLGCGRLKLINDELHEETNVNSNNDESTDLADAATTGEVSETDPPHATTQHHLTPAQKKVCVDFLLRMKLRRKLCNRLVRRLNRIATAMDGKDVSPPPPPRYGDLRLHIDPEEVEARVTEWQEIEAAKKRIEAALRGDESVYDPENFKGLSAAAVENSANQAAVAEEMKNTPPETTQDIPMKEESEGGAASEKKPEDDQNSPATTTDEGHTLMQVDSSPEGNDISKEGGATKPTRDDNEESSPSKATKSVESVDRSPPTLESDYELLQQFDDAYEKVWDPETKSFKYTMSVEDGEPEYLQIKNGAGIGATNRGMTLPDREAEHKRWQSNMLARIPDQPTFEELGMKNRVFFLEARRKRCVEEAEGSDDEAVGRDEPRPKKGKTDNAHGEDERLSKLEDNVSTGEALESRGNEKDEKKCGAVGDETENKVASTKDLFQIKPKRPISFAATPSFHEQDLHRLRIIHHDVVKHAAMEQSRSQLASVTNEYNNGKKH